MYKHFFKPLLDKIFAIIALVLLSPILLIVILLLAIINKGDVFFVQKRPGLKGKIFSIIKLKTMNDKRGKSGNLLPDEDRITSAGKFVRKTSLDEIPQLLNVIKGDMSLIGPRPLLVEYLPLYNSHQARRHEVRPGITGWAQVNGRNAINWQEKFNYDVWYVEHISLALDIKIFWLTILKVLSSDGVSQKGHVTIEKFTGN